jgi:hypothetical protein
MEMMKTVDVDVPAGVVAGPASYGEGGVDGDGHGSTKKKAAADNVASGDDFILNR